MNLAARLTMDPAYFGELRLYSPLIVSNLSTPSVAQRLPAWGDSQTTAVSEVYTPGSEA